jgi:hypothetical protein
VTGYDLDYHSSIPDRGKNFCLRYHFQIDPKFHIASYRMVIEQFSRG